ncbi:unnamed protein product [Sympodiomycopsis kandeliae]
MSSSTSTPGDLWNFLTSNHPASTLTRSVATAAFAGGLTYYVTRPSTKGSLPPPSQPPAVPGKDETDDEILDRARAPKSKLRTPDNKSSYVSASESGSEDEGKKVRFEGPQRAFTKPLPIAVFWDVDNCSPPTGSSGRQLVQSIRKHLSSIDTGTGPDKEDLGQSGPILSFKAYLELSSPEGVGPAQVTLRSELQGSGVSLIDTPKSGRKDVADKMIIADIMAFALDLPPPARIVLISGDRDFAYPLSLIRGRGYQVVLITPPIGAVPILEASANHVARWRQDVLGLERDGYGRPYSTPSKQQYQRSSSPGPSGRKTPPPSSRPMSSSGSQQGSSSSNIAKPPTTPFQAPAPPPSSTLTGPGAAPVPGVFQPLVQALEEFAKEGDPRPLRSKVATRLAAIDKDVYEKAGASSWRDYVAVAVAAGIVVVGSGGNATGYEWIALRTIDSKTFRAKAASRVGTSNDASKNAAPSTPQKPTPATAPSAVSTSHLTQATTPKTRQPSWDDDETAANDDDDDLVSATDGLYTPSPSLEPLFDAVLEAEKVCGRNPPYADVVAECLHKAIVAGKSPDPFGPMGVKSFGAYITAAFKQRVAQLTPSETKDRAAISILPAYQPYLDSLRRGSEEREDQQRNVPAGSSPTKKAGILPNLFNKATSNVKPQNSPASVKGTPNSKKGSAYDVPGLLMAHQPSGARIAPLYFPLANILLVEREKGNLYTTDSYIHPIIAKHKHIGGQVKTSDAFAKYMDDAQKEKIVTLEPGFVAGVRHVRLHSRLHDPKEKQSQASKDRLPPAGADPYTTSPPRDSTFRAPASQQDGKSSAQPSIPDGVKSTHENRKEQRDNGVSREIATETPSVEDRKRFKPLMDVMFALRKHSPPVTSPRRTMVYELLTKKHCPERAQDTTEAMLEWLDDHGASSIGDYTRQAEKFGFVVLGREERPDGAQGKKNLRLSEKYEARL